MRKYRGIVFDMDNTLYDEKKYFKKIIQKLPDFIASSEDKSIMVSQFPQIRSKSNDILGDLLKCTGNYSRENHNKFFEIYTQLGPCKIELYNGALSLIKFAKNNGFSIGVLTNGVIKAQASKLECLKIKQYLDATIFARSEGAKFEKPHPRSFNKIVKELRLSFNDVIFIGDNPKTDFNTPYQNGSFVIWMNKGPHSRENKSTKFHMKTNSYLDIKAFISS